MGAILKLKYTYQIANNGQPRGTGPAIKNWWWVPPLWARKLGAKAEMLGPELTNDAIIKSRQRTKEWTDAKNPKKDTPIPFSLAAACLSYEKGPWFVNVGKDTKPEILVALSLIKQSPLAKIPCDKIERKHIRAFHAKIKESAIAAGNTENKANKTIKWLRRVLNWAKEEGWYKHENPCNQLGLRHSKGRNKKKHLWTTGRIDKMIQTALDMNYPAVAFTISFGYDTTQRLTDLLTATWNDFDGEGVDFTQAKVEDNDEGGEVWAPLSKRSLQLLPARKSIQIILKDSTQRPYDKDSFGKDFRKIRKAAGIPNTLQFRDLRRTGATEIATGGGRSEPLTGHVPGSPMLRVYEVPNKAAARQSQTSRKPQDRW